VTERGVAAEPETATRAPAAGPVGHGQIPERVANRRGSGGPGSDTPAGAAHSGVCSVPACPPVGSGPSCRPPERPGGDRLRASPSRFSLRRAQLEYEEGINAVRAGGVARGSSIRAEREVSEPRSVASHELSLV
jgi:hypothetical protein